MDAGQPHERTAKRELWQIRVIPEVGTCPGSGTASAGAPDACKVRANGRKSTHQGARCGNRRVTEPNSPVQADATPNCPAQARRRPRPRCRALVLPTGGYRPCRAGVESHHVLVPVRAVPVDAARHVCLRPVGALAAVAPSLAPLRRQLPRTDRPAGRLAAADNARAPRARLQARALPRPAQRRHGHAGQPGQPVPVLVLQHRPRVRLPAVDRHEAAGRAVVHAGDAVLRRQLGLPLPCQRHAAQAHGRLAAADDEAGRPLGRALRHRRGGAMAAGGVERAQPGRLLDRWPGEVLRPVQGDVDVDQGDLAAPAGRRPGHGGQRVAGRIQRVLRGQRVPARLHQHALLPDRRFRLGRHRHHLATCRRAPERHARPRA